MPFRPGIRRASTATRPISPTRPGRTAFAKSPTQNAEKTSLNPGRGAGTASRMTVFQAPARTTTERRLSTTAKTIHGQLAAANVLRTRCQSGPRHQISEIASTISPNGTSIRQRPFFTQRPAGRSRRAAVRRPATRSAPRRGRGRRGPSPSRRSSSPRTSTTAFASAAVSPGGTSIAASGPATSAKPWMFEATTGVAIAKASTSTIPKLSPPSAGETNTLAVESSWSRSALGMIPSTSIPSSSKRMRECRRRYCSGSVPIRRSRAPVRRRISGHAARSTGRPLRVSWRPMKTTWWRRFSGSTLSGTTTPFGTISNPIPSQRSADSAALRDTAILASIRSIRNPQTFRPPRIQPRSPAACQVATTGHLA